MILIKEGKSPEGKDGTITEFSGPPEELISDFMCLMNSLKEPKLKLLWSLAEICYEAKGDELESVTNVIVDKIVPRGQI